MEKTTQSLNYNLCLAKEYSYLISIPILSNTQAERIAEILELTTKNEDLNKLIEKVEEDNYYEYIKQQNRKMNIYIKLLRALEGDQTL